MRSEDEINQRVFELVLEQERAVDEGESDRLGGAIDALLWALGEDREL